MNEAELESWTTAAARALRQTTQTAVRHGLEQVVRAWARREADSSTTSTDMLAAFRNAQGRIVVPVRPLLIGGDDVVLLCRTDLAFTFAKCVAEKYAEESRKQAQTAASKGVAALWPATGGELSISAGVLFCATTMPLVNGGLKQQRPAGGRCRLAAWFKEWASFLYAS